MGLVTELPRREEKEVLIHAVYFWANPAPYPVIFDFLTFLFGVCIKGAFDFVLVSIRFVH